ncbi:MAG: hypothetical protein EZS28_026322, partial [Streblomastix strix]
MVDTVNYTKICQNEGEKKQVTGKLFDLTLVKDEDLCVIDFDINKKLPKEKIEEIRQNIIDNMLSANAGLVKTAHGGLHAYCNKNEYRLPPNRFHKQFEEDPAQIKYVQNRVVGPNSTIRKTRNNARETLKYEAIKDWASMTHLANLRDILEKWNVDIEVPYAEFQQLKHTREFGQQITNDGTIGKMNDELAQACIDGLKNLTIYNYPQPIAMEVSLLSVFSWIYGIANEQIRAQGLENIRKFNTLTANAEKNYGQSAAYGERKQNCQDQFDEYVTALFNSHLTTGQT